MAVYKEYGPGKNGLCNNEVIFLFFSFPMVSSLSF
jgi:hypothetical protein